MLALLIFHNLNTILSAKNTHELFTQIDQLWKKIRKLHSPQALGNIMDFKQGVYLGFTLGIIQLQSKLASKAHSISGSHRRFSFLKDNKPLRSESSTSESVAVKILELRKELEAILFNLISPTSQQSSTSSLAR